MVRTHPHCNIVGPGQKHYARIVFLKMGQIEIQENIPRHEMHMPRRQIGAPEQAKHINWYEYGRIRVDAMIEKFA